MKTLTILLLFIGLNLSAQIKIDGIDIPDKIFLEYYKYCQDSPDTVMNVYSLYCPCRKDVCGRSYTNESIARFEAEETRLKSISIDLFYDCKDGAKGWYYVVPHQMSSGDFLEWYGKRLLKNN